MSSIGDRLIFGVFSTLVDKLRDHESTWKIRRHPAACHAHEEFMRASRGSMLMYATARDINIAATDMAFRERREGG